MLIGSVVESSIAEYFNESRLIPSAGEHKSNGVKMKYEINWVCSKQSTKNNGCMVKIMR